MPCPPGKGGAQADIVLTASQDNVPLLFIEVDNCQETAEELAAKLEKYARFFRKQAKDTVGKVFPLWRTRWTVSDDGPDHPYPPVLLVFNHIGARDPNRTIVRLTELTRHLWAGERDPDGGAYHSYDGKIPIVATGLRNLRLHGPAGPCFWRLGRPGNGNQTLLDAIGNPRLDAARARARQEQEARQEAYQAQLREVFARQAAEREARRPVCTGCGTRFTDARWEAAQATDWDTPKDSHPHLCDGCRQKAIAAVAPAAGTQKRQELVHAEAERWDFQRNTRRPVCTECRADFTDERWKATERVGWGTVPERNPTLCGDCDRRFETNLQQAWSDQPQPQSQPQHQHQHQEQVVPEQKATGWFSRLRG